MTNEKLWLEDDGTKGDASKYGILFTTRWNFVFACNRDSCIFQDKFS